MTHLERVNIHKEFKKFELDLEGLQAIVSQFTVEKLTKDQIVNWKHDVREFVSSFCYLTNQLEIKLLEDIKRKTN